MKVKIHVLQNRRTKQFYWRAVSRNGNTIADGAETYKTQAMCHKGLMALLTAIGDGTYKIILPQVAAPTKPVKPAKEAAPKSKGKKAPSPKPTVKKKKGKAFASENQMSLPLPPAAQMESQTTIQ